MADNEMKSLLEKIESLNEFRRSSEHITTAQHFPLSNAYFCGDCENITDSSTECPSCTSKNLYPLRPMLNRTNPDLIK